MVRSTRFAFVIVAALGFMAGALAFNGVQPSASDGQPPADQDDHLPPGWTMEELMPFIEAGTPGEMHAHLATGVGEWKASTTMWMGPDTEPMVSEGRSTVTPLMDGRFFKVEMTGEMPGMGTYQGMGIYGYNNVTEQFEGIWIDNHSTGMMRGTGKLNDDGSALLWDYAYVCPLRKKQCNLREVERITGENTRTLEMHGEDARSGVEYKMMEIEFTRVSAGG